jgi:hypothetical protein
MLEMLEMLEIDADGRIFRCYRADDQEDLILGRCIPLTFALPQACRVLAQVKSSSSIQTWHTTRELRPSPSTRALVLARRCYQHSKPKLCHSNRSGM